MPIKGVGIAKFGGTGGKGGSNDCAFDGNIQIPASGTHVTGTTCEDFKNLFFTSTPPTVSIRATNTPIANKFDVGNSILPSSSGFGYYVIGSNIAIAEIEGRPVLGQNPAGTLTNLEFFRAGVSYANNPNPTPNSWNNDSTESNNVSTTTGFSTTATDDQTRSASASSSFIFTLPYFGTTSVINILTPQSLHSLTASYHQVNMVAETDTEKHTADFPDAFNSITGVQFFNTVSNQWEWIQGSKANSLTAFNTSAVTHVMDVDGTTHNYTRWVNNGVKTGALNYRFYTT